MSDKITLKGDKREVFGKKVKKLRREGVIPANIFGKDVKSLAITIQETEFDKVFARAGQTQVVELEVGKEKKPVLVSNITYDPQTDKPLHVDFKQIDLTKKVRADVPLELVGESPAVKEGKGTVVKLLNEVEIEALPSDFPENISVNVELLTEVNQSISIADLKLPAKLTVLDDRELVVVKVEELREEEPEPIAEPVVGEEAVPGEVPTGEPTADTNAPIDEKPEEAKTES